MIIKIFDLDGILTHEDYSLWDIISENCSKDPAAFKKAVSLFDQKKSSLLTA